MKICPFILSALFLLFTYQSAEAKKIEVSGVGLVVDIGIERKLSLTDTKIISKQLSSMQRSDKVSTSDVVFITSELDLNLPKGSRVDLKLSSVTDKALNLVGGELIEAKLYDLSKTKVVILAKGKVSKNTDGRFVISGGGTVLIGKP